MLPIEQVQCAPRQDTRTGYQATWHPTASHMRMSTRAHTWIALCVVAGACEPKTDKAAQTLVDLPTISNTNAPPPNATSLPTKPGTGTIDDRAVHRLVRAAMWDCYEKAALQGVDVPSTVVVEFFIPPSGHVVTATTTCAEPTIASCVVEAIKAIEFPRPVGGGVQITYPLEIRKAGR